MREKIREAISKNFEDIKGNELETLVDMSIAYINFLIDQGYSYNKIYNILYVLLSIATLLKPQKIEMEVS